MYYNFIRSIIRTFVPLFNMTKFKKYIFTNFAHHSVFILSSSFEACHVYFVVFLYFFQHILHFSKIPAVSFLGVALVISPRLKSVGVLFFQILSNFLINKLSLP